MTFLNFSQLSESIFRPNFLGKHFLGNQAKFFLTGKCFLLTNFSNDKQKQESLENDFPESKFRKINIAYNKERRKKMTYNVLTSIFLYISNGLAN